MTNTETKRAPVDAPTGPKTEPFNVLGKSIRLLPMLSGFIVGYRALLAAQKLEGESPKHLKHQEEATSLLFQNIRRQFKDSATRQIYINLGRMYELSAKDLYTASPYSLIEGYRSMHHRTPGQINATIQAAEAIIINDSDGYTQAIDAYAKELDDLAEDYTPGELWNNLFQALDKSRNVRKNPTTYRRYGDNERRNAVDRIVKNVFESVSGDAYHPVITNSLLVAPTLFDYAIGGVVTDSILATTETNPFANAVDLHLINTFVVDGNGDTRFYNGTKDAKGPQGMHVGRGTQNGSSLINWRGYPDFREAHRLAA